jgi:AcrR family transcriptional regulator
MSSVTRKARPNRRERREQIERQLLEAAERLMRDGASFTELSVDRLAHEAGISRATFYIYFEDKGHLLRRLAGQLFGELAEDAGRWWSVSGRHDPHDLEVAMARIIATFRRHQLMVGAVNEMAAYDPVVTSTYLDLMTGITDGLVTVIDNGQEDGSIRRTIPVRATASALTWMVERTCQQFLSHSANDDEDAGLARALTQIVWAALYLEEVS